MNDRSLILLLTVSVVLAVGFQLFPESFIYLRSDLWTQPWRLWTAHWVHVGWVHLILNFLAFLCVPFIFPHIRTLIFVILIFGIPVLSSTAFYLWYPHIEAYAGFSGVLHGIYAVAAILSLKIEKERVFAGIVLIGLMVKLLWEVTVGELSATMRLIGSPILIEAHQWGVLSAILILCVILLLHKFKSLRLFKIQ